MILKTTYQEKAAAKINLYLDVLDPKLYPRDDGYHNIKTLFQAIDLADSLHVEIEAVTSNKLSETACEVVIKSNFPEMEQLADKNIVHKAIMLYFQGVPPSILGQIEKIKILVHIDKKIPLSAGLGGGSADAAAILRVMNRFFFEIFHTNLGHDQLLDIALKLGADVPFCLNSLTQPRAYAEGIGQDFKDRKININYHDFSNLIMVRPDFGINTSAAYKAMDRFAEKKRLKKITGLVFNREGPLRTLNQPDLIKNDAVNDFYNSFEEAMIPDYPVLAQIRDTLYSKFSANKVLLAGSGSTMVAFYGRDVANLGQIFTKVQETFESKKYSVFKSKFLDPVLN